MGGHVLEHDDEDDQQQGEGQDAAERRHCTRLPFVGEPPVEHEIVEGLNRQVRQHRQR